VRAARAGGGSCGKYESVGGGGAVGIMGAVGGMGAVGVGGAGGRENNRKVVASCF